MKETIPTTQKTLTKPKSLVTHPPPEDVYFPFTTPQEPHVTSPTTNQPLIDFEKTSSPDHDIIFTEILEIPPHAEHILDDTAQQPLEDGEELYCDLNHT